MESTELGQPFQATGSGKGIVGKAVRRFRRSPIGLKKTSWSLEQSLEQSLELESVPTEATHQAAPQSPD